MKTKIAMGSPGSFPRSVIVPCAFRRVFVSDNPEVSNVRAIEYGSYLVMLRYQGKEVARRPWETVHCADTITMYYRYLGAHVYATDTRRLKRVIALKARWVARRRLRHELGT